MVLSHPSARYFLPASSSSCTDLAAFISYCWLSQRKSEIEVLTAYAVVGVQAKVPLAITGPNGVSQNVCFRAVSFPSGSRTDTVTVRDVIARLWPSYS